MHQTQVNAPDLSAPTVQTTKKNEENSDKPKRVYVFTTLKNKFMRAMQSSNMLPGGIKSSARDLKNGVADSPGISTPNEMTPQHTVIKPKKGVKAPPNSQSSKKQGLFSNKASQQNRDKEREDNPRFRVPTKPSSPGAPPEPCITESIGMEEEETRPDKTRTITNLNDRSLDQATPSSSQEPEEQDVSSSLTSSSQGSSIPQDQRCNVCCDKLHNAVNQPCNHGGMCLKCCVELWAKGGTCYLCKAEIKNIIELEVTPVLDMYRVRNTILSSSSDTKLNKILALSRDRERLEDNI